MQVLDLAHSILEDLIKKEGFVTTLKYLVFRVMFVFVNT